MLNLDVFKCAVLYFSKTTHESVAQFYDGIDSAILGNIDEQDGSAWLIHLIVNTFIDRGSTLDEIKESKAELENLIQGTISTTTHIDSVLESEVFAKLLENISSDGTLLWSLADSLNYPNNLNCVAMSCKPDVLNALTLNKTPNVNVSDFNLIGYELNDYTLDSFLDRLPSKLSEVLNSDKELVIHLDILNVGSGSSAVTKSMQEPTIALNFTDFTPFSKSTGYQYLYQIMLLTVLLQKKNIKLSIIAPVDFTTSDMLVQLNKVYKFENNGFITDDFVYLIMQSRGDWFDNAALDTNVVLEKRVKTLDGKIELKNTVTVSRDTDTVSLYDWVIDRSGAFKTALPRLQLPVEIKHKDGELVTSPILEGALGVMGNDNIHNRSITTLPYKQGYVSITEENFWRCVANYTFRRLYADNTTYDGRVLYAPNTESEGFARWLRNALVLFLLDTDNKTYSYRGKGTTFMNKMFILSKADVESVCKDPRVLEDFKGTTAENDFVLKQIEESKPYWSETARKLYDFAKLYFTASYSHRDKVTEWDAGFVQVQRDFWDELRFGKVYNTIITVLCDELRANAKQFGFVKEV